MSKASNDRRHINLKGVAAWVNKVIDMAGDPEISHGEEDDLIWAVATYYAPPDIVKELEKLQDANLTRWYA